MIDILTATIIWLFAIVIYLFISMFRKPKSVDKTGLQETGKLGMLIGTNTKSYLAFVLSIFAINSFSAELKPLSKYMSEADPNDPASLEMIAKRCSATMIAMTNFSREGDEVFKRATENSAAWLIIATKSRAEKYPNDDPEESLENITLSIINIAKEVDTLFTKNQDLTGSLFEGTFLEDDINICGYAMKNFMGSE